MDHRQDLINLGGLRPPTSPNLKVNIMPTKYTFVALPVLDGSLNFSFNDWTQRPGTVAGFLEALQEVAARRDRTVAVLVESGEWSIDVATINLGNPYEPYTSKPLPKAVRDIIAKGTYRALNAYTEPRGRREGNWPLFGLNVHRTVYKTVTKEGFTTRSTSPSVS